MDNARGGELVVNIVKETWKLSPISISRSPGLYARISDQQEQSHAHQEQSDLIMDARSHRPTFVIPIISYN